jgi:tetratricopeptide (TPR) repeat protein
MTMGIPLLALFLAASAAFSETSARFERIAKQADTARAADRFNDAIHLYQEALHLNPQWRDGWWDLASLYYDQDRFPEAKETFHRYAVLAPGKGPADAFLGLCEYELRDYDRALSHFRSWASAGWAGTPQLLDVAVFHFALLLTRDGEFVPALYLLAPEAAKAGNDPALAEAMGLASLRMRNLPEDYPPERREMVWLAGEAAVYLAQQPHDVERAQQFAARLESRYPNEPGVHYFRGSLFAFDNKTDEAEREDREELRISPAHVPAMIALAQIDLEKNELAEADALARKAVNLEPENGEAHHILGRVLMVNRQMDASLRELEKAKSLVPDNPLVRSHLAMVYSRMGQAEKAKAEARAFLVLKKKEELLAPAAEKLTAPPGRAQ